MESTHTKVIADKNSQIAVLTGQLEGLKGKLREATSMIEGDSAQSVRVTSSAPRPLLTSYMFCSAARQPRRQKRVEIPSLLVRWKGSIPSSDPEV